MGKKIVLTGVTLTDPDAPKLVDVDRIEAAGSLFLFDPTNSQGAFTGVPGNAGYIPNAIWSKAAVVVGGGNAESLSGRVASFNHNEATRMLTERTAKGGVHGICSQSAQVAANRWTVRMPELIYDYLCDNQDHDFFVSMWHVVTRTAIGNPAVQSPFHLAKNISNYVWHTANGGPNPNSGAAHAGDRRIPANAEDTAGPTGIPRMINIGTLSRSGTGMDGSDPENQTGEFGLGAFGAWTDFNVNKAASRIIYRAYIEDLTVSGRDYATVDALDVALFNEAFSPGGKFHGDTYTAPSMMP